MTKSSTILVVEDEPLIAMMLEDVLDMLGHRVEGPVDSVAEALVRVGNGGFDAAILDVNLRGGEQSWAVADALAEKGVPFLFASGGSRDLPPERHRGVPALTKPFTMADVEQAVARL